jgi:threonine dehydrogenase-like Zn-dependent dehydrogenase
VDWASGVSSRADSMRASILAGAEEVAVARVRRPDVGRGQVRVQLEGSGVCADHDEARRLLASADHDGLADIVFEAGGAQATLDLASTLCRTGGRLVIAGYHQDGMRTVDLSLWNWRGLDIVNAHEHEASRHVTGMRRAFGLVQRGVLDLDALFTHRVGLDGLSGAFAWIRDRPDGFLKAVVTM